MVLDPKRSNAINIGLTVLPPVHIIKTAVLNFDEFAVNKEGIEVSTREGWPPRSSCRSFPLARRPVGTCPMVACLESDTSLFAGSRKS